MIDRGEQNGDMPITSIIRRRVQEGHEANFEEWCRGIDAAANRFSGYQGIKLIYPEHTGDEYVTIINFDSYNHYLAWQNSPERAFWLQKVRKMTEGDVTREFIRGFDYWLGDDNETARSWPPQYRMVLIAYLAIWPLVYFVTPLLGPHMPDNPLLASLLNTAIITLLMGYISLPLIQRIALRWLQKK